MNAKGIIDILTEMRPVYYNAHAYMIYETPLNRISLEQCLKTFYYDAYREYYDHGMCYYVEKKMSFEYQTIFYNYLKTINITLLCPTIDQIYNRYQSDVASKIKFITDATKIRLDWIDSQLKILKDSL